MLRDDHAREGSGIRVSPGDRDSFDYVYCHNEYTDDARDPTASRGGET